MKNTRLLLAARSLLPAIAIGGTAHAAGTAAGTVIQNTATATYSSGSASGTVQSNTISVKVDELLNVAVTSLNSSSVAVTSSAAVLTYSVTNTGNGTEPFHLTADPNISGNGFNGTIQSVVIDTNGNGIYDPGVDTVITNGAASPTIAADGAIKVFVLVTLPVGATDAQTSQVRLTAASVTGTGTPGTIFAGKGDGGVDAVVGLSTAQANALGSLTASLAAVTLTKSAVILDPFGGATPVPGSVVTYSLVTHTTGTGTANGVHVTDNFPTGTTYQPGTMTLGGTALTDAADADAGTVSGTGIDVSLGNLAGGSADKTVTFKVKIN